MEGALIKRGGNIVATFQLTGAACGVAMPSLRNAAKPHAMEKSIVFPMSATFRLSFPTFP
jgi:hypothetical protein